MLKKFLITATLIVSILLSTNVGATTSEVCKSYPHHPTVRSAECISFILAEIKSTLEKFYGVEFATPDLNRVNIRFFNEKESEAVRFAMGSPTLLGLARDRGSYYDVIIMTETDRFKQPVNLIIIHELVHVMDYHNSITDSDTQGELIARDVASLIYLNRF